ncbi:MAG TPA: FAD-binding protein [Verrucomicrobiae bacterium]|nr:FAD-binding protein [Verrucomicrobiae bacterium]
MVSEAVYKQLLRDIRQVDQQVSLGQWNGLGAGGRASYFTEVRDAMELAGAVKAAIDAHIPYEIVGAGKSVLFPDEEYQGLVISNKSEGFIVAADRSQVVVESGMSLQRFITMAASRGYGGMTQFYGHGGTIGGAVYHGLEAGGTSILSFIRHITVLMPPTKMKPYPTVVRQRADWLRRDDKVTKLRHGRDQRAYDAPRPVLLNVQFQLTSVRPDEIQRRIQRESEQREKAPSGLSFGPVFMEPGGGQSVKEILTYSKAQRLVVEGVRPDKREPNYLRARKGASASAVWQTVQALQQLVKDSSGIELTPCFERLGYWPETRREDAVVA